MRNKRTSPPENGDPPENDKNSGNGPTAGKIGERCPKTGSLQKRERFPKTEKNKKNLKTKKTGKGPKTGKTGTAQKRAEHGERAENGENGERPENGQPANVKVCRNQAKNKIFPKTGKLPENGSF